MRIYSWNSNNKLRWEALWSDPIIRSQNWDVIAMQEVGAPQEDWELLSGPSWVGDKEEDIKELVWPEPPLDDSEDLDYMEVDGPPYLPEEDSAPSDLSDDPDESASEYSEEESSSYDYDSDEADSDDDSESDENLPAEGVIRLYRAKTPFGLFVFIIHCQWLGFRKNHTIIITKKRPMWYANISGGQAYRPILGIKVQLKFNDGKHNILFGCVHLIAKGTKAVQEIAQAIPKVIDMCREMNAVGFILAGDFNSNPQKVANATKMYVSYPGFSTHGKFAGFPIDYILASDERLLTSVTTIWEPGRAHSDHRSIYYQGMGGASVKIL